MNEEEVVRNKKGIENAVVLEIFFFFFFRHKASILDSNCTYLNNVLGQ